MSNTIKFTKGQQVWQFGNWNDTVVAYRLVTVESWGAKTGTVSRVADGEMSKSRVYTDRVNNTERMQDCGGEHFFAAVEGFDPAAKALELSAALIACNLADAQSRVGHAAFHQPSILAKIEKLTAATPAARAR
jgi:hypothetical protein